MAVVQKLSFLDSHQRQRVVELLHPERATGVAHETTLITGQNGSQKSYLLKELVSTYVRQPQNDLLSAVAAPDMNVEAHQVFCVSGSVADRFPQKESSAGRRSTVDVPHYTYVGQRVGNNLLSRKAPLETMLSFALSPKVSERYGWEFFVDAHRYAGVHPTSVYGLAARGVTRETMSQFKDIRSQLMAITTDTDEVKYGKRPVPNVSSATARWLVEEFSQETFDALQKRLLARPRFDVVLSEQGAQCESTEIEVLRLGLLSGILRLQDVRVHSLASGAGFSALVLSSGEYQMFSTILAVGFGLEEKATLLIDEPENSLHPQWQRDLMATILGACAKVMKEDGHVIVCTHSPLVWAAAGSVDTDLSFLSSLELYGTEIAERRMPTRRVVEALDVIEHV